ncbi:DNA polymerase/3'-5' exonuclease PolX [Haloechinothrix sp. YIM 98757]|uniref:DNA polymerase beta n=1 Tax=Haloechinothrix aidingensis TaxID=2752311 RepID=A0A838AB90_9PSEU|nr:DNA polymerase/3'-5' exonuclease PolX [Haloechinothrix aidingensis]MBA0126486.1 DNA polymerase/3'-5' exonuclease PolX [Haloechinothrix aidingensis]
MARPNDEVAALLQEYSDLLSIGGGAAYKVRAYEKAARAISGHPQDISVMDADTLRSVPGVGKAIADKVLEYLRTGSVRALDALRDEIPPGVRDLIAIPNLGPRKAATLYHDLGIASTGELVAAIHAGRLREIAGFGARTEENILHGIELTRQHGERVHLDTAMERAEELVERLLSVGGCQRCTHAGSLRRFVETIGDVDVLAAADEPGPLMETFTEREPVEEVIATGETKSSIRTTDGLRIDLRVVPLRAWGAALQYFTGSRAHNIRTREIAGHAGLKLSEYGLFDAETDQLVVSETEEEEVYNRLALPWIPPPLREDRGEIEAARKRELPDLVSETDIRGDLHTHTDLTDGVSPLEDMVATAAERGYAYYAVTDHAPGLPMHRMTDEKVRAQRERVRELDGAYRGMRLLHGSELNIGPDGEVDWPEEFLNGFDVCVASVHTHFDQPREEMTRRLVRACENPCVNIIGHPTARLIGRRPAVDADLDEVFRACARTRTALEINASPRRLDLRDDDILLAKQYGVRFAVDSDAHSAVHLAGLRYGVGTAQRAWLTGEDVINTWPLHQLRRFLRPPS